MQCRIDLSGGFWLCTHLMVDAGIRLGYNGFLFVIACIHNSQISVAADCTSLFTN